MKDPLLGCGGSVGVPIEVLRIWLGTLPVGGGSLDDIERERVGHGLCVHGRNIGM